MSDTRTTHKRRDLSQLSAWSLQELAEHARLLADHVRRPEFTAHYRIACLRELGHVRQELARREGRFDE